MKKIYNKMAYISGVAAFFLPLFASAQTVRGFFTRLTILLKSYVLPIFGALIIAVFIWGVVKFIASSGDPAKIKDAKTYIVIGLIALFFLVAFWALVNVLMNTFFGGPPSAVTIPLPF